MDSYGELHALDAGAMVEDAGGQVYLVTKHKDQTWLYPFSDEYAVTIRADGTVEAEFHVPPLPIKEVACVPIDEPAWRHPEEPEDLIAKRFDELNQDGWWHPEDGEVYLILFKTMVKGGIPRTEAFQYLHMAYNAAANEFGG